MTDLWTSLSLLALLAPPCAPLSLANTSTCGEQVIGEDYNPQSPLVLCCLL